MASRLNLAPRRLRILDELGTPKALSAAHDVVSRSQSHDWLLLGLGPDPAALANALPPGAKVRYLECPAFFDQTDAAWRATIPASWTRVQDFDPQADCNILLYRFAVRLFPRFWAPVCAALLVPNPAPCSPTQPRTALLAARQHPLVAPEAALALREEGFEVFDGSDRDTVLALLEQRRPDLFLSINFTGLDRHGEVQAVLARAGVPTAAWCVDNPFHALSGVKTTAWRELHLFVTDDWFIEPLRRHGATSVHHLPLAASPGFFTATKDHPELADKLLFVGRSAFPDKELFFSGLSLNQDLWKTAQAMLARGERPDFAWWVERLGIDPLWPGLQARRAGYGAEEAGLCWRTLVIEAAAATDRLAVCGDAAWRTRVTRPFTELPAVNYFGPLAGMYASARYVVGAVSPLLPHGLTQRHFDVWAAGGCLLTDDTPGLALFPQELTRPVTYRAPEEIPELAKRLEKDREDLIAAWREYIRREHTYGQRIRAMLAAIAAATQPATAAY